MRPAVKKTELPAFKKRLKPELPAFKKRLKPELPAFKKRLKPELPSNIVKFGEEDQA